MSVLQKCAIGTVFAALIGLGISYGPVYLFHFSGLVFLIAVLRAMLVKSDGWSMRNFVADQTCFRLQNFLWLMIAWYAVTIIWSRNMQLGLFHLFYISNGILIVLAFQQAVKTATDLRKIISVSGIIVFIEFAICFMAGLFGIQWPISPYSDYIFLFGREPGFSENLPSSAIEAIRHTPTGFRWNPNDLAVTMLIVLPFFLFYRKRVVALTGTFLSLVIILFTGSRGALIGLFVMSCAFVFLYLNRKQKIRTIAVATVGLLILFAASPLLKTQYPVKYREISTTTDALNKYLFTDHEHVNDTSSITIRQNLVSNGLRELKNTYGLGVGAGNSVRVQMENDNTHGVYSMHNFWIEILVEAGILFFILWCVWYFLLMRKVFFIGKRHPDDFIRYNAQAASLAMIGLTIGLISMSSAIYFLPMYLLFGISFSVCNLNKTESKVLSEKLDS